VHRGVVRLVMNTTYARFDTDETFLQLAPLSFDASTFELWAPLVHGARCVVYPAGVPSPERLGEVIRQHHVSTLWLTASLFNVVIDEAPGALRGVSQLLIGGEQLSTPHVRRAQERLPGTQIINGYGPTESTTFTCCYAIPQGPATDTGLLSIGRPIANTRVYILDQEQNPVPVGIQGELYIGGDGLARGYLNRPELTAEMFIPDPFIAELGARLYRTGDLVRYRPDGNIEFLGRIDRQVKIRGFRIELEEIEAVLGRYPGIREAAVVAREDTPGDKRLAAYLVRKTEAAATATTVELRRFLQQKLPEYMIPSVFVFLETMPLTNSGKVDRRALPAPDQARPALGESYVAPRTPVEEALARIWSEVLGVERVGVHDNFFELGGHSLLAVRLFSRIVEQLGKKLPLATLFRAPTIDGLAAALEEDAARGKVSSLVEIQRTGCNPPLYVLHDLGGDVFFARHLPIYFGVDHPVYGLHAGPASGIVRGQGRLEELAAHYVEDLVASRPNGPYCLVGYSFGGFLAYEVARQLSSRGLRVGHLAIVDTGPSFRGRRSIAARLRGILHFLRNIRWWVQEDLLESRPGEMFQRLRRKVREVAKRLKRVTNSRGRCARGPDLEDIFDLRNLPEDYVRTMDYHLRLLREYQPRPYSGPLTLYRARTQRLFCLTESDLGWGRIVSGGIEVVQIPGNHDSIVKEPHVRLLAEALRGAIDRVAREPHGGLAGGGQTKTNPRTSE
jgi:thioesterase domain-containing protein/acyl carrier protein